MGKSSPSAPAAPDPVKTANAQTASNIDTANAQAALNHSNQITPWGSQIWTQGPKNSDGTSSWTSTISLDPSQQSLLDSNNQISQILAQLGIKQAGAVGSALDKPVDFGAAPAVQNNPLTSSVASSMPTGYGGVQTQLDTSKVPGLVGGDALNDAAKRNQQAAYNQQSAYLDPQYKNQQGDLENKLVQQGIPQNSDAWNRAMDEFSRQKTFDYNNAYNNSFATGLAANNQLYNQGLSSNQNAFAQALASGQFANQAQGQQYGQSANNANMAFSQGLSNAQLNNQASGQGFNQSMAARNQNLSEQQQAQQIPINLLNALRSGSQVTSPTFGSSPQGNVANTDIAGLYNNQYQGQLAQYNSQQAGNNSIFGALTGLGGAALMSPAGTFSGLAALLSDRRLKTNIKRVGTHASGIGLYTYDYIWGEPGAGVMADEVEKVMPDAVLLHPSGFKMVNYGKL